MGGRLHEGRLYVPKSKCVNKVLTSPERTSNVGSHSAADEREHGMRIGLVGVGRIGAFHAATLKGLPAVEQGVVADADAGRAGVVAKELGLEYAADVDTLLRQGLDGFVIAAATSAHAALIAKGLEAGLATFCEKPVAQD